jgi:multidrug efflux pump subunit AcrB
MSKERPYEYVPTYAIAVLQQEYSKLIQVGFFKLQSDLDKMNEEMSIRFDTKKLDERQISIEEYTKSLKNNNNRRQ